MNMNQREILLSKKKEKKKVKSTNGATMNMDQRKIFLSRKKKRKRIKAINGASNYKYGGERAHKWWITDSEKITMLCSSATFVSNNLSQMYFLVAIEPAFPILCLRHGLHIYNEQGFEGYKHRHHNCTHQFRADLHRSTVWQFFSLWY